MVAQSQTAAAPSAEGREAGGSVLILKETASDWMQDNAMRLSAALSLYTILSLAPLLVISLKIISVVWRNKESAQTTFMHQITLLMGSNAAGAIQAMLENGGKHGQGVIAAAISLVVLLFSASGVFGELQDSMNTIWGVKLKPNQGIWGFLRNRFLSMGMVLGIAFLLLVSMFVSTMMAAIADYVAGDTKWFAFTLDMLISFGMVTVLFAAIFKFLPDVKIAWRDVWLGAVLTAALFIVGKYCLALYFKYATPTSAFGAAGSLAAVLLWVYYSAFILFFGAEFTKVWSLHHGNRLVPSEHAVKVTEEDKAQRGIPSEKRIRQAAAGQLPRTADAHVRLPAVADRQPSSRPGVLTYAVAAGALAAGYGARYLLEKRNREIEDVAGAKLKARLNHIEGKLGHVSRISSYLKHPEVLNNMPGANGVIGRLRDWLKTGALH
jgi:membrane protein